MKSGKENVDAKSCTTPDKNILCEDCEQLFRHIDYCAFDFWKDLSTNWSSPICRNEVDITNVVMFSIVARAMLYYELIPKYKNRIHPRIINDVMQAFRVEALYTDNERKMLEGDKKTDTTSSDYLSLIICTYKNTRCALEKIGFMCYKLSQNHDLLHCRNRKYRVEFPFRCALKLPGETKSFEAVCAQVPPFFCLIPIDPLNTAVLKRNLHIIALAVNDKLQTELQQFFQEVSTTLQAQDTEERQKQHCQNIYNWYEKSRCDECFQEMGPLLCFDYLDGKLPLDIDVHECPWCYSVSCSICCLCYCS